MSEVIKNEQKTRDLAEKVMGFVWTNHDPIGCWRERFGALRFKFSPSTSRDDCAEVLARLTDEQWSKFTRHLIPGSADLPDFAIEAMFRVGFSSTPAQIAEAVWRAVCQ